jgi:hypothetical protein
MRVSEDLQGLCFKCFPEGGNLVTHTDDVIRELALPLGFVDVKVCAVTDVWSGLKLVVRKELR